MIRDQFTREDFLAFQASDELITYYEQSWQSDQLIVNEALHDPKEIDQEYKEWNTNNELFKNELLASYEPYFQKSVLPLDQFKELFPNDPKLRVCHYTNLSDYYFEELRKKGGIKTKNARGRYMEIDRLNSNKEYFRNNIVLCCYWANNAKTDEFTEPEFLKSVGPALGEIFRARIKSQ